MITKIGITKTCPSCPEETGLQPLDNFGIANGRPFDHFRNLYCKPCIRKKVTASRRALADYRESRRNGNCLKLAPTGTRQLSLPMSPDDRVKQAIQRGAHTQKEIRKATGLTRDELGECLASLMLWRREVKRVGDFRYVLVADSYPLLEIGEPIVVRSNVA